MFGLEVDAQLLVGIGLLLCLLWVFHALRSPLRHKRWEQEALRAMDARHDRAEGTGSS